MSGLLFLLLLDLNGRVVDSGTGQPIRKAYVFNYQGPTAVTDGEGRFTLRNLKEGPQRLFIEARGYTKGKMRAGKPEGATRYFHLTETAAGETFTAYLRKGARVEGTLVDHDGDPIAARTEVMLLEESKGRWEFAYVVLSETDGRWEFYGLPAGRYAVGTKSALEDLGTIREGEERHSVKVRTTVPAYYPVELATTGYGQSVWTATLHRRMAPVLPVELTPQLEVYPMRDRITGPAVPAGDYTLRAFEKTPEGIRTLIEQPFTVRGHEELQPIAPNRFAALTLRVRDFLEGTKLRLEALEAGNQTDLSYGVDETGTVRVASLSPGRYRISAVASNGEALQVEPGELTMPGGPMTFAIRNRGPEEKKTPRIPEGKAAFYVLTEAGYFEDKP